MTRKIQRPKIKLVTSRGLSVIFENRGFITFPQSSREVTHPLIIMMRLSSKYRKHSVAK